MGKSFEELMSELESIVQRLEKGELSLDLTLQVFQQGVNAFKEASGLLSKAELKVRDMMKELEVLDEERLEGDSDLDSPNQES